MGQRGFGSRDSHYTGCPDLSGKPLGISTCFTAFIVLFFGASISIILLMTEVATKILKRQIYRWMDKCYFKSKWKFDSLMNKN